MKTITTLIILTISFSLNAQDYFSNNPQWRQNSGCRWWGDCIENQEFVYYLNGDSIVDNISYKKVFKHGKLDQDWIGPPPYEGCNDHYTFNTFHTLVRQEGLKVYIKDYGSIDTLLYDFDLNIGDTLPKTWNQNSDSYIISSLDSLLVGNTFRKVFYFEQSDSDFLIEGIGHYGGFLEPFGIVLECGYHLDCYSMNDTTYFPVLGAPCDLTVNVSENYMAEIIKTYPNPTIDLLTIEYKSIFNVDNVVAIDINGSKTNLKVTSENQNKLKLDMSDLSTGLYIIQINFGNETFKRLKAIKE